mmetsp:Transcript_5008/g.10933  ORF Transcript_5008/g.10933 Transcript_5008/m.10933 type:complete len:365 (-) Transcript_5008:1111-2205(-)
MFSDSCIPASVVIRQVAAAHSRISRTPKAHVPNSSLRVTERTIYGTPPSPQFRYWCMTTHPLLPLLTPPDRATLGQRAILQAKGGEQKMGEKEKADTPALKAAVSRHSTRRVPVLPTHPACPPGPLYSPFSQKDGSRRAADACRRVQSVLPRERAKRESCRDSRPVGLTSRSLDGVRRAGRRVGDGIGGVLCMRRGEREGERAEEQPDEQREDRHEQRAHARDGRLMLRGGRWRVLLRRRLLDRCCGAVARTLCRQLCLQRAQLLRVLELLALVLGQRALHLRTHRASRRLGFVKLRAQIVELAQLLERSMHRSMHRAARSRVRSHPALRLRLGHPKRRGIGRAARNRRAGEASRHRRARRGRG